MAQSELSHEFRRCDHAAFYTISVFVTYFFHYLLGFTSDSPNSKPSIEERPHHFYARIFRAAVRLYQSPFLSTLQSIQRDEVCTHNRHPAGPLQTLSYRIIFELRNAVSSFASDARGWLTLPPQADGDPVRLSGELTWR